jgi:pimeloyl-ACP methyl ester carboxylesterase
MRSTPTVVLVHGAFADASAYAGVIRELQARAIQVRAPMNPLRGLAFDADAIARYTTTLDGPIILVGHSYGGAVISQAAPVVNDVIALVFLSAFAPDKHESCASVQEPAVHGQADERQRRVSERRIACRVHRPPRHRCPRDPQGHRNDLGTTAKPRLTGSGAAKVVKRTVEATTDEITSELQEALKG